MICSIWRNRHRSEQESIADYIIDHITAGVSDDEAVWM